MNPMCVALLQQPTPDLVYKGFKLSRDQQTRRASLSFPEIPGSFIYISQSACAYTALAFIQSGDSTRVFLVEIDQDLMNIH